MNAQCWIRGVVCMSLFALAACGGGGGGGGGAQATSNDPVEKGLNALGVDTTPSARVDANGDPLPDGYSPLGAEAPVYKYDELMLVGMPEDRNAAGNLPVRFLKYIATTYNPNGTVNVAAHWDRPAVNGNTDWQLAPFRAAAAGDVDEDGRDELAALYRNEVDNRLYLRVTDDPEANLGEWEGTISNTEFPDLVRLQLIATDLDGDGRKEFLAVVTLADSATIYHITGDLNDGFAVVPADTRDVFPVMAGRALSLRLAAGNLDQDRADELALVVNELSGGSGASQTSAANYHVLDDAGHGLAELGVGGPVFADGRPAALAGAAIGDLDGDGIGDLVLGGVTGLNSNCSSFPDYVVEARKWTGTQFDVIGSRSYAPYYGVCGDLGPVLVRTMVVNALDIDGDGVDEIQANQVVFEDLADPATALNKMGEIGASSFFPGENSNDTLGPDNAVVAVGDFTTDGRDDIAWYTENQTAMRIFGIGSDPGAPAGLSVLYYDGIITPTSFMPAPIIIPTNIDTDSYVLSFSPAEYKLVFTEPVIEAVLAAPPCFSGIGQNTDACATSYGTGSSSGTNTDKSFTVSAGIILGAKVPGPQVPFTSLSAELEITGKASVAITSTKSHAYTVEKSITYTTGAMEDTVVFTTVPYDEYVYTILSHPDPDQVGGQVRVMVPREPITLQVERSYYNAHYGDTGFPIDNSILAHTIGDPNTYPTAQDKSYQINGGTTGMESPPPTPSVGEGGGNTTVQIAVSQEWAEGRAMDFSAELEVKATAGVAIAGFTVGISKSKDLSVTSGTSTIFEGSVGNIPAAQFTPEHQYKFGMFTYPYNHSSGQTFNVINYWVE